jgi:hypothetical protein
VSGITLTPALAQAVREGRKTVHRVPFEQAKSLGDPQFYAGQRLELIEGLPFGKVGPLIMARIQAASIVPLEDIDESEITREGYDSWALFSNAWDDRHGRTHGQAIMNPLCWRIEFRLES